jgi:hypothetical protein
MNNKGQSVVSEYVTTFFIVIAAVVAITVYTQRALEARIHDARNYMIDAVINNAVCDANCMLATGNTISHEYEPYYTQTISDVSQNQQDNSSTAQGNPQVIGVIYRKSLYENTNAISTSTQLPPGCADGANPKPAYCG